MSVLEGRGFVYFCSVEGGTFPLSDASSLLMRLEMAGVDVKERARELVSLWEKHNDTHVSLFYDGHAWFNALLAGDQAVNTVLLDNMREYINDNRKVRLRGNTLATPNKSKRQK